jgi:hypothetical protein
VVEQESVVEAPAIVVEEPVELDEISFDEDVVVSEE